MRIVFMGTPDFAVPSLQALIGAGHEVCAAYTQPDKPQGRKQMLTPPPVKVLAQQYGIPVYQPATLKDAAEQERLRALAPEAIIVAAYGKLLPKAVLDIPPRGCINVHGSLLPRWRGAAPIQRAILAGDERTGVSIMRIGHGVDTGAYCAQASCEIGEKGAGELTSELARMGAELLVETLPAVVAGTAEWVEQDEALVTHAAKIEKSELALDARDAARANALRVQASGDTAPARCTVAGRGVRVCAARAVGSGPGAGEVCVSRGHVLLGCADGALELVRVKPDGKREMDASAWAAGLRGDGLIWGRV